MSTYTDHLWRLEQLSRMQLSSNLLVAAFVNELHKLVSSYANSYLWLDKQANILNIYDEHVPAYFLQQLNQFLLQAANKSLTGLHEWIQNIDYPAPPLPANEVTSQLRHFYRDTLFEAGYHQSLFIPVFIPGGTHKTGLLLIHRQASEPPFSPHESQLLIEAAHILAKGLQTPENTEQLMTNGWEEGLIVLNKSGDIQHICPTAEKLLILASQKPDISPLETPPAFNLRSFRGLDDFIDSLMLNPAFEREHDDMSLSRQNQWGEFKLTGFVVRDTVGNRAPHICLNIKWLVPFTLNLFLNIDQLKLTPRQEMIALLYAAGHPAKTMANTLGLSLYTVKEHVQNIFERLNIHSRAELIELIVCDNRMS